MIDDYLFILLAFGAAMFLLLLIMVDSFFRRVQAKKDLDEAEQTAQHTGSAPSLSERNRTTPPAA